MTPYPLAQPTVSGSNVPRPDTLAVLISGIGEALLASHAVANDIEQKLGVQIPSTTQAPSSPPIHILSTAADLRNQARLLTERLNRIQAELA